MWDRTEDDEDDGETADSVFSIEFKGVVETTFPKYFTSKDLLTHHVIAYLRLIVYYILKGKSVSDSQSTKDKYVEFLDNSKANDHAKALVKEMYESTNGAEEDTDSITF